MPWLKLTSYDGSPIRINTDKCINYYEHTEGGGNTFFEYAMLNEKAEGAHVKETLAEIDAILQPTVVQEKKGWT